MVRFENVKKYYGSKKNPICALDLTSFHIEKGEFAIITGPSGSGKTTLLNLMGGMTHAQQGEIIIAGQNLSAMKDAKLSAFRADTLGFIFQFQSMISTLNALDNVLLPSLFSHQNANVEKAKTLLDMVGLNHRHSAFINELSIGEQRRVSITRAVIGEPSLLLCDEPTGDLDPDTEAVIMDMILNANKKGTTIVMVTHNHDLKAYATRLFTMSKGCVDQV